MLRALAALVALAVIAGCGGASFTSDEELSIAEARVAISHLVLDGSDYGKTLRAVDDMIALYRAKPDAEYDGLTMRQHLQDMASDLGPYRPEMAAEIDRALD
jgi:ABC-type glycerol-3-phosphate transport system substrate-binding protein